MKNQNGFSLVEVLVASVILAVGMLAMAASTGYIGASLRSSSFDTQRTQAKQQIVEELRAQTWNSVATNTTARTIGRLSMTWNVALRDGGINKRVQLITSGPAYLPGRGARTTVTDTMTFDIVMP